MVREATTAQCGLLSSDAMVRGLNIPTATLGDIFAVLPKPSLSSTRKEKNGAGGGGGWVLASGVMTVVVGATV